MLAEDEAFEDLRSSLVIFGCGYAFSVLGIKVELGADESIVFSFNSINLEAISLVVGGSEGNGDESENNGK